MEASNGLTETPYGAVRTDVLDELVDSFDTFKILRAVDVVDEIRGRCPSIPDGTSLRDDLLKLHGMAHSLINDDVGPPPDGETIYDLASELSDELREWSRWLRRIAKTLDKLSELQPEIDD